MTPSEAPEDAYARVIRNITRGIVVIGALGAIGFAIGNGWRFGLGFATGACLSYLSFWRWRKVVDSLGGAPRKRSIAGMVIRFAALVAIAYVMIKYLEVNPVAVFFGMLVAAAAAVISIFLELIYARI